MQRAVPIHRPRRGVPAGALSAWGMTVMGIPLDGEVIPRPQFQPGASNPC